MFEALAVRAARRAVERARRRSAILAEQLAAALPPGIAAEPTEEGVRLLGRNLRRQMALDPALRWLGARFL